MRWPWQRVEDERRYTLTEIRSLSFQDVWGQGLDVSDIRGTSMERAASLVPVFACSRMIADSIAAMPIEAYRKVGDERIPIDTPALFQEPSRFAGSFEWIQRALISLLLRGNAFGIITEFDYYGYPRQIEWVHPDEVQVMNNNLTMAYLQQGHADWRWLARTVTEWIPRGVGIPGDLVHIPWYTMPGFILGLSPVAAFSLTIDAGIATQKYGRDWFKNGGRPSGVLESDQPISQPQAVEVKARYKAASSGADVAVIGAGLHYKPITVPPEEAQFLQTIRATASQIASIYGLPAHKVGGDDATSHRTYANVEQESQDLVNALLPYLTKLERTFSNLLPRGQYVKFNVDSQVRADLATRYAAHQIALGGPMGAGKAFMTVDEVRQIEDMQPMEVEQQEQQQIEQSPAVVPADILPMPVASGGAQPRV